MERGRFGVGAETSESPTSRFSSQPTVLPSLASSSFDCHFQGPPFSNAPAAWSSSRDGADAALETASEATSSEPPQTPAVHQIQPHANAETSAIADHDATLDMDVGGSRERHEECEQPDQREFATLPVPASVSSPAFLWGDRPGDEILSLLEIIHAEVVHWRGNVFIVPLGASGKRFVIETARLAEAFADGGALESVAMLAMMVMPSLLLQAPCPSSHQDRVKCLDRRMILWQEGKLEELLREGRVIQGLLAKHPKTGKYRTEEENMMNLFSSHMHQGKIKSALRLLSPSTRGGVLPLDQEVPGHGVGGSTSTVRDILKSKHPAPGDVQPEALLPGPPGETHPVIFDRLNHNVIRSAVLHGQGSAGPSGLDVASWRRLCTMYHGSSKALCSAIARMARRIV